MAGDDQGGPPPPPDTGFHWLTGVFPTSWERSMWYWGAVIGLVSLSVAGTPQRRARGGTESHWVLTRNDDGTWSQRPGPH